MFISKELLINTAEKYNISLDDTAVEKFDIYAKMLVEYNKVMNLTGITEPDDIVIKHFIDSLTFLSYNRVPEGASLIDVGTGAGFPGVPLMIARPDLKVTLLDSTKKRLNFLSDVSRETNLQAEIIHARAEDGGKDETYREKFDFATARAVTNLRDLSEYCLPYVKVGGYFVAMKSAKAEEEISGAKKAIHILGGQIEEKHSFDLEDAGNRTIIKVKKICPTPTKYPRPSAKMAKFPLE